MVGYVCTVASGKGGVGKTTTAVNVGAALSSAGADVVIVDADLGMANLAGVLGLEFDHTVHDVLAGDATVSDALTPAVDGLRVVPGETALDAFAEADPARLQRVIDTLKNTHDVVVVDTGSGLSHETAVPLGLADGVLLVTTPDGVASNDTAKTAQLTDQVDGEVVGLLVTRARREVDIEAIRSRLECPFLGVIPADEAAGDEPLVLTSPASDAAVAYERVTDTLRDVFLDGTDPGSADPSVTVWDGAGNEDDPEGEEDRSGSVLGFFRG